VIFTGEIFTTFPNGRSPDGFFFFFLDTFLGLFSLRPLTFRAFLHFPSFAGRFRFLQTALSNFQAPERCAVFFFCRNPAFRRVLSPADPLAKIKFSDARWSPYGKYSILSKLADALVDTAFARRAIFLLLPLIGFRQKRLTWRGVSCLNRLLVPSAALAGPLGSTP